MHTCLHTYLGGLVLEGDDSTLNHLVVEIVALAGTLADAGEHGVTTVSLGHVVDQLHDQHSLAHTGTAEKTNLTYDFWEKNRKKVEKMCILDFFNKKKICMY